MTMLQLKFQHTDGKITVQVLKFVDKRFNSIMKPSQQLADTLNSSDINIPEEPNDKLF